MKYIITNRYTDKVIVRMEAESLKEVVEKNKADLSEANLFGADLSKANLSEADLSGADLYSANLFGVKIKITQKDKLLKSLNIIIED